MNRVVSEKHRCPRCRGPVPNLKHIGEYPGAVSYVSDFESADIEICSACGTDEGFRNYYGWPLIGTESWPLPKSFKFFQIKHTAPGRAKLIHAKKGD